MILYAEQFMSLSYHLLICASPQSSRSQEALSFAQQLLKEHKAIAQLFFYAEAVRHLELPERMDTWLNLCKEGLSLRFCSAYVEVFGVHVPANPQIIKTGLVDFFARHWQDQGMLIQF